MSSRKIALFSLIIASIIWASSGTIAKILLPVIDPIPLMTLRLGVAIAFLLPFYFGKKHPSFVKTLTDTWPTVLAAAGNFFLFIIGVSLTTANAAAIIYTITPLLTLFLARARIQEYNSPTKLMGIILGLLGVIVILFLPIIEGKQSLNGDPLGNVIILCAAFSWTYYIVSSRQLIIHKQYEPMTITTYAMTGSFVLLFLLSLITPHKPILPTLFIGIHPWLILFYGGGVTAITFLLHQWAIKHSSATTASLTNYLQPLFAFLYNGIFVGEHLSVEFLVGSALVLVGTFLATSEQTSSYLKTLTFWKQKK